MTRSHDVADLLREASSDYAMYAACYRDEQAEMETILRQMTAVHEASLHDPSVRAHLDALNLLFLARHSQVIGKLAAITRGMQDVSRKLDGAAIQMQAGR